MGTLVQMPWSWQHGNLIVVAQIDETQGGGRIVGVGENDRRQPAAALMSLGRQASLNGNAEYHGAVVTGASVSWSMTRAHDRTKNRIREKFGMNSGGRLLIH